MQFAREAAQHYRGHDVDHGWGRARREPEWSEVYPPGTLQHVRTKQLLRRVESTWRSIPSDDRAEAAQ